MSGISGFCNQLKIGASQFFTVENLFSSRFGNPTISMALRDLTPAAVIAAVTVSQDQKTLTIQIAAHGAKAGDVLRLASGWEYNITKIIDPNNFEVINTNPSLTPVATDVVDILRWIPFKVGADGSPIPAPAPTGLATAANQDYSAVNTPLNVDLMATPITSADYLELVAATAERTRKVQIFCSGGFPAYLAFGAMGAEDDKIIIIPGGNGYIDLVIPAGTRLSAKALDDSLSEGALIINFLG